MKIFIIVFQNLHHTALNDYIGFIHMTYAINSKKNVLDYIKILILQIFR